jgi:hypothetical protein
MHSCLGSDPRQLESDVAYANAMTLNTRPGQQRLRCRCMSEEEKRNMPSRGRVSRFLLELIGARSCTGPLRTRPLHGVAVDGKVSGPSIVYEAFEIPPIMQNGAPLPPTRSDRSKRLPRLPYYAHC